jgi:hypothetical protein
VEALLGSPEGAEALDPGWVFLPPALPAEALSELINRLAGSPAEWSPLLAREAPEGLSFVPVALGFPVTVPDLASRLEGGEGGEAALSYRKSLSLLSRVRHDVNNALTVALAEAQLTLLDLDEESDAAKSLRTVEGQIQRVRGLVAELSAIRAPRR